MALPMTVIRADFPNATVEYRQITPNLGRVLDSIEVYGMSRITYNEFVRERPADIKQTGLPDVWRINPVTNRDKTFTPMTKDFQFWIYRINVDRIFGRKLSDKEFSDYYLAELDGYKLKHPTIGQSIRDFNSLFRDIGSHTNYAGTDNSAFFIGQERMDWDLPKFSNIVTGRWVGKMEGDRFVVINASKPYTHYHPFDHPWLFDEPLSTGRIFKTGTNIILRDDVRRSYNDFRDRVVMPVILPASDYAVLEGKWTRTTDEPLRKFG